MSGVARLPDLEGWAVFARVAELGSFAGAAAELGLSTATVSKAVARLERRVGAALLARTSRRVALTALGREVAAEAGRLLAESEGLEAAAASQATRPRGLVRLALPMGLGVSYVAPLLPAFFEAYPEVLLEVSMSDELVDLVGGGFDFAVRLTAMVDSSLRARRVCGVRRRLVASPGWVARHGRPARPEALPAGELFSYTNARTPTRLVLRHVRDGTEVVVPADGRLRVNGGEASLPALLAGLGVAALPEFIVWEELRSGRLVSLLEDWMGPATGVHIVTPPGARRPMRVTVAMEFLAARLAEAPWAVLA